MKINWTYAAKTIVSVLGSIVVYLQTPNMGWKEATVLGITNILVWLVPNANKTPAVVTPTPVQPLMLDERAELNKLRAEAQNR